MSDEWVTIATFNQVIDAHLVKTMLEAEGIESFIENEDMNWLYSSVITVKLNVRKKDAEKAAMLIE